MAIITLSRGTMSGGEALASSLSAKLGWPAVSREVIAEAAAQFGIQEKVLAEQLAKNPGFLRRYAFERRLYLTALQSALIDRALKGSFIYHGNAGHLLLKGVPRVLKVRLIAPMDYRVRMVTEKKGLTAEAAQRHIQQVDRERMEWTRFLYNVDWADPSIYDIVFNMHSLSVDGIADMICQMVRSPEFADTPESRKVFEQCSLAARVRASLARSERTRGMDLDVEAMGQTVRVSGSIPTGGMMLSGLNTTRKDIFEVARATPGVENVEVAIEETSVPME